MRSRLGSYGAYRVFPVAGPGAQYKVGIFGLPQTAVVTTKGAIIITPLGIQIMAQDPAPVAQIYA